MKDSTYMEMAWTVSRESKCISKNVGAIIVHDDNIISTGYNGTPSKHPNCCDVAVSMGFGTIEHEDGQQVIKLNKSNRHLHSQWSEVNEIHAEQNAVLRAAKAGRPIGGATIYTTHSPCPTCCKLLSESGIVRVVYDLFYDRSPENWAEILYRSGIEVTHLPTNQ